MKSAEFSRTNAEKVPIMHDCVATGVVAGKSMHLKGLMRKMLIEIRLRNRKTGLMRKIREKFAERDMRKISELLQKVKKDEAVIEIRLDAEPLL